MDVYAAVSLAFVAGICFAAGFNRLRLWFVHRLARNLALFGGKVRENIDPMASTEAEIKNRTELLTQASVNELGWFCIGAFFWEQYTTMWLDRIRRGEFGSMEEAVEDYDRDTRRHICEHNALMLAEKNKSMEAGYGKAVAGIQPLVRSFLDAVFEHGKHS